MRPSTEEPGKFELSSTSFRTTQIWAWVFPTKMIWESRTQTANGISPVIRTWLKHEYCPASKSPTSPWRSLSTSRKGESRISVMDTAIRCLLCCCSGTSEFLRKCCEQRQIMSSRLFLISELGPSNTPSCIFPVAFL